MLVTDILGGNAEYFHTIRTECSDYIRESGGLPVFRTLPRTYNTFQRVKVRAHKRRDGIDTAFNNAFESQFRNIAARSIVTQSSIVEGAATVDTVEPFYVFPTNGYKFIYSKGVQNTSANLRGMLDTLTENVHGALEMTADLIKYTYTQRNLLEGITHGSEIIFYGIPYYYAVKVADMRNYANLINK